MDGKEVEKISESVKKILNNNKLLTLSTYGKNGIHSNTAFYTFDKDLNLYIWSEEGTEHSQNLRRNGKVSVNIFDSKQKWGSLLKGLQATGSAKAITNRKELILAGILYLKRFPAALKIVKNPKRFNDKIFESKIYKIEPKEIKVFDEKTFGKGGSRKITLKRR
ncbi:MAG: pyridoxamine 5'-phosphate oxidase family protein [Candidatus Pacearchaeota archaeon]